MLLYLYLVKYNPYHTHRRHTPMLTQIKLSEAVQQSLRCPSCKAKLELRSEKQYQCENPECGFLFPIINGIPILIDEDRSIFSIDDFVNQRNTTFYFSENKCERAVRRFVPQIIRNIKGRENYSKLEK